MIRKSYVGLVSAVVLSGLLFELFHSSQTSKPALEPSENLVAETDPRAPTPPDSRTKPVTGRSSPSPLPLRTATESGVSRSPDGTHELSSPGPQEDRPPAIARFAAWTERYASATSEARLTLLEEGEVLAQERRAFLHDLIAADPEAALTFAVPSRVRRALPARLTALLEEAVSGRGTFGVLVADTFDASGAVARREIRREVVIGGRTFEAYVYGARLSLSSRRRVPLRGIAVGNRLAVHADVVRRLDADDPEGAWAQAEGKLCPVSNRSAGRNGEPVAGEVAGQIEYFCGAGHLALLNERLAGNAGGGSADGGDGGGEFPVAADSWTQGPKTCLFMRVAFPDDPAEPISEDGAYAMMDGVNQWYTENSYDTTSLITMVTPLLQLPQTKAWYGAQGTGVLLADARDAAREVGLDPDNYHWDVLRHNNVPGFGWAGLGYVHGKGTWLQSSSVGVAVHELGHNFGLWHANFWSGAADGVIGPGSHVEYGNSYDTMGAAAAGNNQFNAAFKNQLDWLPDAYVGTVITGGTYRLHTFDVPSLTPGRNYALKLKKNYGRDYWLEFRQKFSGNRWFLNGVLLNWSPWNNGVTNSAGGTHLLDTKPGSAPGRDDSAVVIGRTFSDRAAGIHLTPIARGAESPENWIDVVVQLGSFPDNHPPEARFVADRTTAPTNGPCYFTAFATDRDGDALAYAWDFGDDTFGPNSPNVAKSWSVPGEYNVRLTVSDMKGGIWSGEAVVTVGAPSTYRITGRVVDRSGEPVEGVRVHNGQTAAAYRVTHTDSDGRFSLVNLPEGELALSGVKYGYTLARSGWTNPVAVGPGTPAPVLEFVATADPIVTISAPDPNASEVGLDPGRFTVTRLGPTNVALAVKFNRTGQASFSFDYQMTPVSSNSPLQVVIPAGASANDILVRPLPDTLGEGREQVTLSLIEDAAYVLGSLAEATVFIADDDPAAPPSISVSVVGAQGDNAATESGADSASFVFTRSGGNLAQEIAVFYAVSGTATPGEDYSPLAGVVTIPVGETSTAVALTAIDDFEVETNETVVVSVLPNAAYANAGGAATLTLIDNDPTTVTIVATDAVAREAGGNSGTFTVTRVGDLSANLIVAYALGGTAVNSNDYSRLSGRVTIPAGRAATTLNVTPVNDALVEGDESVTVTLLAGPACNVGRPGDATIVIVDDELPTITLAATDNVATEGAQPVDLGALTFTRNGTNGEPMTVYFKVDGTALRGVDYEALGDHVEIPAGQSNVVVQVTPLDDAIREVEERVVVTLVPGPGYNVGTSAPQTVAIKDNDTGLPGVGFTLAESNGRENEVSGRMSVSLSTNSASTVTVQYAVTGGTAIGGGVDYTLAAGTLTLAAGKVNQSINFNVTSDALAEEAETIQVTLTSPAGAVLDAITTHTYTIIDDDSSGVITVSALVARASENGDRGVFRMARSGGTNLAQRVNFEIVGTASSPSDYLPLGRSVVIPAGARQVDVEVVPVDDATDEADETVVLTLQPSFGAVVGFPDTATITIVDNDGSSALPLVSVTAPDPTAAEPGVDRAFFSIARDRGTNESLLVSFTLGGTAVNGTDYSNLVTSVVIPAGAFATNLVLVPRDDATFEPGETVVLTLTQPDYYRVGRPASATVTLIDNENGVSVAAEGLAGESGAGLAQFVFSRTGSTSSNLVVNFSVLGTATGGDDYVPLGTNVVIPAGTNRVLLPVMTVDDTVAEGAETIVLVVKAGTGYAPVAPTNATVVVMDDESAVSIAAAVNTVYEADGAPGRFVITRAGATNLPLAVRLAMGGTAANGVDYASVPETVTIPAGAASTDLIVAGIDDTLVEGDETVRVTILSAPAYAVVAPGSAFVTLVDDESNRRPVVSFTTPSVAQVHLSETNSALVLEVDARDDGRPDPPGTVTFTWSVVSGPAPVAFGAPDAASTLARFAATGAYVLRVVADDGQISGQAHLAVVIGPDGAVDNLAPIVSAGTNRTVLFGERLVVQGTADDDSLPNPPGALVTSWGQASGPGEVTFEDAARLETAATFSVPGVYTLRLIADDGQVRTADEIIVNAYPIPTVNIRAVAIDAAELGPVSGRLEVTRTGDLGMAVNVELALGGTATSGEDYAPLGSTLAFAPGVGTLSVDVMPLVDSRPEGNETVLVTLLASPSYVLGTNRTVALVIRDLPFDAWRWANFSSAELQATNVSGEFDDLDGDGWVTLLEYAFNRNPRTPESVPALTGAIETVGGVQGGLSGSGFVVTFQRRRAPTDLVYEPEVSSDGGRWESGTAVARLVSRITDGNGVTATVKYLITVPKLEESPERPRLVRVRVQRGGGGTTDGTGINR